MLNPAAHVTAWGWFWLAWICTGVGVELWWVFVNTANTLSEQIWGIEKLDLTHPLLFATWTPAHWTIAACMWLFFGWMSVHMPFGWVR